MGMPSRISRVFLWTVAGVVAGTIVGAPFAQEAARRDPAIINYTTGGFSAWPPIGITGTGTANAAAQAVMSFAIALSFFGGLAVGLIRNGFFSSKRTDPE